MVIPTANPSADSGAGMAGAAQAAPLRSHSGAKAINPGSARAEPSPRESLLPHWPAAIATSLAADSSAGVSSNVR